MDFLKIKQSLRLLIGYASCLIN